MEIIKASAPVPGAHGAIRKPRHAAPQPAPSVIDSVDRTDAGSGWFSGLRNRLQHAFDSLATPPHPTVAAPASNPVPAPPAAGTPASPPTKVTPRPDLLLKLRVLQDAGMTFTTQSGQPVSIDEVCARYASPGRLLDEMTATWRKQAWALPGSDEDVNLLMVFALGTDPSLTRHPELAAAIRALAASGHTFRQRWEPGGSSAYRDAGPAWAYANAASLTAKNSPFSPLFFAEAAGPVQIQSTRDFERAGVVGGVFPDTRLSPKERMALPLIRDLSSRGCAAPGAVSLLKAVGEGFPPVAFVDSRGRRSDIAGLEDLERVHQVYAQPGAPADKGLPQLASRLLDEGGVFTNRPNPHWGESLVHWGAPAIAKAALGEPNASEVFYHEPGNALAEINRPQDLQRIQAIYHARDISRLPRAEQDALTSLRRIFDSQRDPAVGRSTGMMGFLKGILGESEPGELYMDRSEPPEREVIQSLHDIDRYAALYLDKNPDLLPLDERTAGAQYRSLREAGYEFLEFNQYPVGPVRVLQVLKRETSPGGAPRVREILVNRRGDYVHLYTLRDLARLDALCGKKDPGLLPPDERGMAEAMRKLSAAGFRFGNFRPDDNPVSILQGLKDNQGRPYLKYPGGSEAALDDRADLSRLVALYVDRNPAALRPNEAAIVQDILDLAGRGYRCARVTIGRVQDAETFDVLKSVLKGYPDVGLVDAQGAFTPLSSRQDLDDLKAIVTGEGLERFSPQDRAAMEIIQRLLGKGYRFHVDTRFSTTDPQGKPISMEASFPVGVLPALAGLRPDAAGRTFVRHPGGSDSVLDGEADLVRLDALTGAGSGRLPVSEKAALDSIRTLMRHGYRCGIVYQGALRNAEPFDVLRSTLKGYAEVGMVDPQGAFSSIASLQNLQDLEALVTGRGLDRFSAREREVVDAMRALMAQGYQFQGDGEFSATDSLGRPAGANSFYPVGLPAALQGVLARSANLWMLRGGKRMSIYGFLDMVRMHDRMQEASQPLTPPRSSIVRDGGYVIVGGVRIPVRDSD